jgi:hypothetical protein
MFRPARWLWAQTFVGVGCRSTKFVDVDMNNTSRQYRRDQELDMHFDVWSDVNQPKQLGLTLRGAHSTVARVVKGALERDGWQVELRKATKGPTARADRLLPPMF